MQKKQKKTTKLRKTNQRQPKRRLSGLRKPQSCRRNRYCHPPAIEGTSSTSSPSWNEYEAPPRKRISSSFT